MLLRLCHWGKGKHFAIQQILKQLLKRTLPGTFLVISKTVTPSKNYSNNFKKEQILSYYAIQHLLFTYMICRLFEFVHIPPVA